MVTYQGVNDTRGYVFFQQDQDINKKMFRITNDSDLAENDYTIVFRDDDKPESLENITLGTLTLSEHSQNIMFSTFRPVMAQLKME